MSEVQQATRGLYKPSKEYREAFASLQLVSAVVSARLRAGYTPTAEELRAEDAAFDRLLHARQAYWRSVSKREDFTERAD